MNEYRVGKLICHSCKYWDNYVIEQHYIKDLKTRCPVCSSGLTTWTPHTTMLGDSTMTADAELGQGVKYDVDKLRYDLLPSSLAEVVHVYTQGAKKYADRNWEKGLKWSRVFRAMITHAFDWWWSRDSARHERGMHPLGSVAWCALALMEYEKTHPEFDDRPYGVANGKGAS